MVDLAGLYAKPKSVEQKGYELIVGFMRRAVFVGLVNIHAFNQKMPEMSLMICPNKGLSDFFPAFLIADCIAFFCNFAIGSDFSFS